MTTRVYVAGSSQEMDRASRWIDLFSALTTHMITLDWTKKVREAGSANPPDWTRDRKTDAACEALDAVADADLFWLLVPNTPSQGCWVELGVAYGNGLPIYASGRYHIPFFGSVAHHAYSNDEHAFAAIAKRVKL